ncbi:Inositol-1,4,5-trisphosphate 5-phosphatase 1 [Podosphaera aphanis]|nr:Inositol-1,4,5-trisphosphate 5-phosphatase 1 [Podosphaera aphanis]
MAIRVLLRAYPHRSIALVTQSHALIFHTNSSTTESTLIRSRTSSHALEDHPDATSATRYIVEFSASSSVELDEYQPLSSLPIHGTLGLININNDVFLCVVKEATRAASIRPGETVERISGVEFYCLNKSDYDHSFSDSVDSYPSDSNYANSQTGKEPLSEHPCLELKKLLGNGSFYFSTDFDLTNRLQNRSAEVDSLDVDNMDESFLWNSYMIGSLVKFRSRLLNHEREELDRSRFLTSAIRGFVHTLPIPSVSAPLRTKKSNTPSYLTLISRLSCRRAGTRFNSRGIDDDGNVANFVESETIYWSPSTKAREESISTEELAGICFSYVQIRGSVPVFWEQAAGLLPGQQKITITRSPEGSQPTFEKHINELEQNYGSIHIVNLLSETKPGEAELTSRYRRAVKRTCQRRTDHNQSLSETEFDFHAETKGPSGYESASMIKKLIKYSAEAFAYYLSEGLADPEGLIDVSEDSLEGSSNRIVNIFQQHGVFRTNCLDCLDRTNLIQTIISQMAVESFLSHRGEVAKPEFWACHSSLWADNGDALSCIYAGTGALKSSFTRHGKMSFAGAIADARKSATRLYINNFADKGRQNTIDLLLGRLLGQTAVHLFDPINEFITNQLSEKKSEYQSSDTIKIWCGTFNLNGKLNENEADISPWLFPGLRPAQQTPEIVAVGFQEIVELSPQQIMNSDPSRRQAWEKAVQTTLNKRAKANGDERYILLRSGQLVGAALMIFVKKSKLSSIRNVEGSFKKTGLSGMAGNKGAVAIRIDYANTSICFVTAHFAAGHANYGERNLNYNTIHSGLRFQRNRCIDDHDTVIWMGDFNYRIDLSIEKVNQLIDSGDLGMLYEHDQLKQQMTSGLVFHSYTESNITFMPTYKFNLNEDIYDTSEKARIPAWTDRILRKGDNIQQVNYNIAPLRFSDHRPVYATFLCTVRIIDEFGREALSRQLYDDFRARIDTHDNPEDSDLIQYDIFDPGLPPKGSGLINWQIGLSNLAQSQKDTPHKGMMSDSSRPSNSSAEEPDWVKVPRSSPPRISRSISSLLPQDLVSSKPNESKNQTAAKNFPQLPIRPQNKTMPLSEKHSKLSEQEKKHLIRSKSNNDYISSGNVQQKTTTHPIVARKPDHLTSPPIVRKPVHLASSSTSLSNLSSSIALTQNSISHSSTSTNSENENSYNKKIVGSVEKRGREAPVPPVPRRSIKNKSSANLSSMVSTSCQPQASRSEGRDLLGDENNSEVCRIKALKPK